MRKITGDTVPSMSTAMMLSQKTGSLKSGMPLMVISSNETQQFDAAKMSVSEASESNLQMIALSRTLLGVFAASDSLASQATKLKRQIGFLPS